MKTFYWLKMMLKTDLVWIWSKKFNNRGFAYIAQTTLQ